MAAAAADAAASTTSNLPVVTFWERNVPYASMAVTKLASAAVEHKTDPKGTKDTVVTLTFPSGDQFVGTALIVRYLARAGTRTSTLLPKDALDATMVDQWVDYLVKEVVMGGSLEAVLASLNSYLTFRSYMVGQALSLADVVLWGQLQGLALWKKHKSSGKLPHLSRLFDHVGELPECKAAVEELLALDSKKARMALHAPPTRAGGNNNSGAAAAAAGSAAAGAGNASSGRSADAGGSFDIQLPGAEMGKVVTRFPPEPSGYLHIGHAKAALLNQYFADMYKGKLLVRFDDTNPSKEKDEFVENILKDIADLGLRYETLTYTSDYFPQLFDMGERLIKAGYLYADDTPVDQMREERMNKVDSKCRNRSVAENLAAWEEMKKGSEQGLATAMRFKAEMQSLNGAMRDPVAFRCNLTPHWRTGTKYKMYPTYDCACPFVDAVEGVTHALRTSEYKDREEQYYWVLKVMQKVWPGLPNVHIWDYSRLNFVNTVLSKRKLTWFVDTGRVTGWSDPRMPTVQGVLRRGMQIEALREFILGQGASKNVTFQEWDKIWATNKQMIDPVCPRHTAVVEEGKVLVRLSNGPAEPEFVTVAKHKKYPPAGKKTLVRATEIWLDQADAKELKEGEEVTLMDWGNAIVRSIHRAEGAEGAGVGPVTSIEAELHLEGDVKKTKWKLTWLAKPAELVPLQLVDFDYLITKKKIEEDDDFQTLVNPNTRFETAALGDPNMRTLQKGDVLQLERKGYFIVDVPAAKPGQPVVLFNIPDGRAKSVATKA